MGAKKPAITADQKQQIDHVIQYLDWALIGAHAAANPDCSEVNILVDLERRSTTTSYTVRGQEGSKRKALISLREATVLRDLCDRRIKDLKAKQEQCAGSLYPGIMQNQIGEIEALFERLTTFPLGTDEE